MANHVQLNSAEHKDLCVITERAEKYGDNVRFALTFPAEFRFIAADYPIFFQKQADSFLALALLGFEDGENLFLNENTWDASYIPLSIRRQPFLIGKQRVQEGEQISEKRVIHIDMDNPRVSNTEGEPLFREYGGNTEFLDSMAEVLETLHLGIEDNIQFIQTLVKYQLLEPFTLEVDLDDGSKNQLIGFHTIHEENLRKLDAEALAILHEKGWLEGIYMALASQSNIRKLIQQKNIRVAAESSLSGEYSF